MLWINYALFRLVAFPLQFLPYPVLHFLGKQVGRLLYYYPKYRKRSLSNLALASSLNLKNDEIILLAKQSLQNLAITALEYPRLYRDKAIINAFCDNPETVSHLIHQGKGVIFFCGHQANWEILFLEGTYRMPGVAIGRPIQNHLLYEWILTLRQKFGGVIIPPKKAYKASLQALKAGKFLGIVGDQSMPSSSFYSSFLGRRAYTSNLPALLSERTGSPIIVATIKREKYRYRIHYSDPIFPEGDPSLQMKAVLDLFEKSILETPSEWLWIHNRWKQPRLEGLTPSCRSDSLVIIFKEEISLQEYALHLRTLYPTEQLTIFVPAHLYFTHESIEVIPYHHIRDILQKDYRFKLLIDFTNNPLIHRHYKRLSVQKVLQFKHPKEFFHYAFPSLFSSSAL
ncbi:MAG: hypothetical protein QRY71_02650 [Candidatus Rhabdochlamydia sp.]